MYDLYVGQQIEVAIIDLFICGAEPTSSALSWAILCMVAFPDIQRRCHEELDCVCSLGSAGYLALVLIFVNILCQAININNTSTAFLS